MWLHDADFFAHELNCPVFCPIWETRRWPRSTVAVAIRLRWSGRLC